jgi:hypothetical protein
MILEMIGEDIGTDAIAPGDVKKERTSNVMLR